MKFHAVAAIVATVLATLTEGAPTPEAAPDQTPAAVNLLTKRQNLCLDSSFRRGGGSDWPLVADCNRISQNIAGGGSWGISSFDGFNGPKRILTFGTCAFTLVAAGQGSMTVGNEDVRDLIRDSIRMYQSGGRVSAYGYMECAGGGVRWDIVR